MTLVVVSMDQATKYIIQTMGISDVHIGGLSWVRLVSTTNDGVAFGLNVLTPISLGLIGLVVAGGLYWFVFSRAIAFDLVQVVAAACIEGGIIGNAIDRLGRGAVIDFIDIWMIPTFNIADAALVTGVIFFCIRLAFTKS